MSLDVISYVLHTTIVTYYCIPIGIPPVENLMAVDNCTSVTVSWDIRTCKGLSYSVSLTSPDSGVILQSITTDTINHTFMGVDEMFNVSVTAFNENSRGPSHTAAADVRVSSNG